MGRDLYIPMYHYVRDIKSSEYPRIKAMDAENFRKQIAYFCKNFNVVKMEDVIAATYNEDELPQKSLLLTFDDGYADCYNTVFPVLKEYGVQGSFFIPGRILKKKELLDVNKIHFILACTNSLILSERLKEWIQYYEKENIISQNYEQLYETYARDGRWDKKDVVFIKKMLQTILPEKVRNDIASELYKEFVGKNEVEMAEELYINYDQLKEMKSAGMHIGSHGFEHYWLSSLESDKMQDDIDKSLETLKDIIDLNSWTMCYPKGSYSDDVVKYCEEKGAKIGLTAEYGVANMAQGRSMRMPRLDCNFFYPISDRYKDYI